MKYFVFQCHSCESTILVSEDITRFCLEHNMSICELLDNECCIKLVHPDFLETFAISGSDKGCAWEVEFPFVELNDYLEDESSMDRWDFIAG